MSTSSREVSKRSRTASTDEAIVAASLCCDPPKRAVESSGCCVDLYSDDVPMIPEVDPEDVPDDFFYYDELDVAPIVRRAKKWKFVVYNAPKCRSKDGVRFVTVYKPEIPPECTEAIRAAKAKNCGWKRKPKAAVPGIPNRRFDGTNVDEYGTTTDKQWRVQALYAELKPTNLAQDEVYVHYEGWTPNFLETKKAYECVEYEAWKAAEERWNFLEELNKRDGVLDGPMDTVQIAKMCEFSHPIWEYEDMGYFHTMANKEYGGGSIQYMCRSSRIVRPPMFTFIPFNLLDFDAYDYLCRTDATLPFRRLSRNRSYPIFTPNVCESPETCKCDARFALLYGQLVEDKAVESLKYTEESLLDFYGSTDGARSVVMECSDECGCSRNCPRRRLQRGQTMPLIVVYEGRETNFALQATRNVKKGELLGEYTGQITFKKPVGATVSSYEVEWNVLDSKIVIDARKFGGVARFINHSCAANTRLIEVYSREKENDVLVPRIGVFASKNIKAGDKITLHYWPQLGTAKRRKTPGAFKCECGAKKCIGWLPSQ